MDEVQTSGIEKYSSSTECSEDEYMWQNLESSMPGSKMSHNALFTVSSGLTFEDCH
jgi:hypothetical protein